MKLTALRRHPFRVLIPLLMVIFLVLFPKGGIKIGDAPITWGYVILGLTAVPLAIVRVLAKPLRATPQLIAAAGSLGPFQMLFVYSWIANGMSAISEVLSIVTGFFFLPAMFLLVYPSFIRDLNRDFILSTLRNCIFWAAVFGIFLFIFHPITGFYIEIPYLTVNAADFGQLEATKHIDRGRFLKLISTYNNGNVYGAATLILFPLYKIVEPKRWKRNLLSVALVLTLSRTVWAGLLFEQFLSLGALICESLPTFPRVPVGAALKRTAVIATTAGLVLVGFLLTSYSVAFLFDSDLGGRGNPLVALQHGTFLPSVPLTVFTEILYASAVNNYGYSGLVSILLIFGGPVIILISNPKMIASPTRRAAFKGLILYALICSSDGATTFIPVMAFYWFAYMTFLCGLPGSDTGELPAKNSPAREGRYLLSLDETQGLQSS